MTETIVSGKMPVLALRGLTVFPDQTVHFDVGRPKSVLALEAAMKADQNIFLVPQRDIMDNDPPLEGLYQIGVVAKAKQVLALLPSSNLEDSDIIDTDDMNRLLPAIDPADADALVNAIADNGSAIELYEAMMAQEEINSAQDDALIELYEMIGG